MKNPRYKKTKMCKHQHYYAIMTRGQNKTNQYNALHQNQRNKEPAKYQVLEEEYETEKEKVKEKEANLDSRCQELEERFNDIKNFLKYKKPQDQESYDKYNKILDDLDERTSGLQLPSKIDGKSLTPKSKLNFKAKNFIHNQNRGKPGRPKKEKFAPDANRSWEPMIKEALEGENNDRWNDLLQFSMIELEPKIESLSEDLKIRFHELYKKARNVWKCEFCHGYECEKMRSGYVECEGMPLLLENSQFN